MFDLLVVAVALAMDATAASASVAAAARSLRPVLACAALFGLFQAGMAGAGWWGGLYLVERVAAWDHWVAFVLLSGIGLRTVREGLTHEPDQERPEHGPVALVVLAFATSIDALCAGVTGPLLGVSAAVALAAIGVVTAALSLGGGLVGRRLGDRFGPKLNVVGGVVLVGLGAKILLEHLAAG